MNLEELGQEFCHDDAIDQLTLDNQSKLIGILFVTPFAMLTIFDHRLQKHMDPLLRYLMVMELTLGFHGLT